VSLAHGTNDAQKTMGVITLALIVHGSLPAEGFEIPFWVKLAAATAIAAGSYAGGWRLIRTLGSRLTSIDPPQGFASEASTTSVLLTASSYASRSRRPRSCPAASSAPAWDAGSPRSAGGWPARW
jgi:inorganic phosphate transporter, PiT family